MERERYEQNARDMVRLVSCALNGEKPDAALLEDLDQTALFKVAEAHMLTAAVGAALESAGKADPAFHEEYSRAIRNEALRDAECRGVFAALEAAGVWYMPLKGAVMKGYYPIFGIRQMSDVDVLIDASLNEKVGEIMLGMGYTRSSYDDMNEEVYKKPPIHQIEMHTYLASGKAGDALFDYYADVKDRLICEGGMRYRFTPEDMYLYMLVHEYKHYIRGGTGLRSLLDVYVYLKKFADSLDFEYIANECEKLGISDFEEHNRRTALALFGGGEVGEEDRDFLRYVVFSGVYGTEENYFAHKVEDKGKLGYLKERLFLPMEYVQTLYPFFYKHRYLLPALFVYRIGKMLTVKSGAAIKELKRLMKHKK